MEGKHCGEGLSRLVAGDRVNDGIVGVAVGGSARVRPVRPRRKIEDIISWSMINILIVQSDER